jgi:hypothetical protein
MMADKREGTSYAEILKEKLAHTPAESTRIEDERRCEDVLKEDAVEPELVAAVINMEK